jgi:hypothetical protein
MYRSGRTAFKELGIIQRYDMRRGRVVQDAGDAIRASTFPFVVAA